MGYPSSNNPSRLVFLQRLVEKFVDQGDDCTVISPVKFPAEKGIKPIKQIYKTKNGNQYNVYFPRYFCVWLSSRFKRDYIKSSSTENYIKSVFDTIKAEKVRFDCVYSHFLGVSAECATRIKISYKVPCFAAAGESTFEDFYNYDRNHTIKYLNELDGIVSVSSENKQILLENNVLSDNQICVIPNGVDGTVFFPRDKTAARKQFGFIDDAFVCVFVGHFIQRKGPLRVLNAVSNSDVKVAFVGKGEQTPTGANVIWNQPLLPNEIPVMLSASDVFVLPTLNEGCCNAIIEAMACGLPIISSNRSFNDDILDETNSIKVDPESVDEIRNAIMYLKDNPLCVYQLSKGAIKTAELLDLNNRANRIREFMSSIGKLRSDI